MHPTKTFTEHDDVTAIIAAVRALDLATAEIERAEKVVNAAKLAYQQA